MTFPIETTFSTGATLYAIIHNPNGQVWRYDTNVWENYNPAHWAQYAVPLTEQGSSGYYKATYPAAISNVLTTEVIYGQGGGSPVVGDAPPQGIAQTQGANLAAVGGDASAAPKYQAVIAAIVRGTVISGTLTTKTFTTDVVNSELNAYQGRSVVFATGVLSGQGGTITTFNPSTQALAVAAAFTAAPAPGDVFVIV